MLADTVGFIDRLPHALVAAFRATLEEVVDADLLLQVVDASADDRERRERAVRDVLEEIGASEVPVVDVFNKCDRIDPRDRDRLAASSASAVCVSATRRQGLRQLLDLVASRLAMDTEAAAFDLDYGDPRDRQFLADVHRHGQVTSQVSVGDRVSVQAVVPRRWLERTGRLRPTA
jgi:GTP-binding protein HflX